MVAEAYDYDLIVVGAGIAGMVSAVTAAGLGKRVAVVEKRKVGGNCSNYTCVPSKTLIRLSHTAGSMTSLHERGLLAAPFEGLDPAAVMDHIRSVVDRAYQKDRPETFEEIGVRVIPGAATFTDPHHVEADGRLLSAEKFILAVGTRPMVPPIPGLGDIDYLTNETLYDLERLPRSLIILGGGVDGLEYGSAFCRLGVETTVVEMAPRVLPFADRELVKRLVKILEAEGLRLMAGTRAARVQAGPSGALLAFEGPDGQTGEIRAERVLVALGRRPDLDGLGLDRAGVSVSAKGVVTDRTLCSSMPHIYACGDIVGPDQLASMAEYQGIVAALNAFLPVKQRVDYSNSVYVIFTEPPLAFIGLTEARAHAIHGHRLKVYRFDYKGMRRAMIDGTESGMAKFLCDGRGRLVGAHILGEAAGEVIHEAQVIKALKKPLHKLRLVTHAYPTYAQALVGRASQLAFLDRMARGFFVNAGLSLYPGVENRLKLARDRLAETGPAPDAAVTAKAARTVTGNGRAAPQRPPKASIVSGAAWVIDPAAELIDEDDSPILASMALAGPAKLDRMILNFGPVRRMNGLAAAMLVKLTNRATRAGQLVSAFGLDDGLRAVLKVTDLDMVMDLHDTRAEALAAAGIYRDPGPGDGDAVVDVEFDTSGWASPTDVLEVGPAPEEARNLNVNGRRPVGPVLGFGRLWQKAFRLSVADPSITPEMAMAELKADFPSLQPSFNRFYPSRRGIRPGEVVLIDAMTPGGPVSTGVMTLYEDERSFTFNCPQGHPECGFVSFSARKEAGLTAVRIVGLARAGDALYEAAFRLAGSRVQTRIWTHVLTALAARLGVPAEIGVTSECLDHSMQWRYFSNIRYNAQIRTLWNEPKRWVRRK